MLPQIIGVAARTGRVLLDYAVIWTVGNIIEPIFWALVLLRVVRISGYSRLLRSAWKGRLIIAANHPSLVETVLIPGLGWPWMLVSRRYYFWYMPDRHLFPGWLKWFHTATRGIEVDRRDSQLRYNIRAIQKAVKVLQRPNSLVVHVEGGRTFKWRLRQVELLQRGDRQLAEVKVGVFTLAKRSGAHVLPLWVGMTPERQLRTSYRQGFGALFSYKYGPITLNFDHPAYQIDLPLDPAREKIRLEQLLLNPSPNSASVREDVASVS